MALRFVGGIGSILSIPASHQPLPLAAEEKKKLAEEKAIEIEEQNKIIAVEKAEAETALAEVMPILEAAKLELQKLDKSDVTEIRYQPPPSLPPASLELSQGLPHAHPTPFTNIKEERPLRLCG